MKNGFIAEKLEKSIFCHFSPDTQHIAGYLLTIVNEYSEHHNHI